MVKDQQTQEEDDEPRRAAETAFAAHKLWRHLSQKHTHSKVKKRQQGNPTCKASRQHRNWSTLTQGAKTTKPRKQAEQDKPRKPPPGKTVQAAGPEEEDAARPLQPNPRSRPASWRQTC